MDIVGRTPGEVAVLAMALEAALKALLAEVPSQVSEESRARGGFWHLPQLAELGALKRAREALAAVGGGGSPCPTSPRGAA